MNGGPDVMLDSFFACHLDQEAVFIQYWTDCEKFTLVDQYIDFLPCHNQVLLLNVKKANFYIEIVKQLVKQHNYIVLMDIAEVCADVPCATYQNLVHDCPSLIDSPLIIGGDNHVKQSVNVETFFFDTLNDLNVLRSKTYTVEQIFDNLNKSHTFLYLNGADYPHRNNLWHKLQHKGLLTNTICSYLGYNPFGAKCDIAFTRPDPGYDSPWIAETIDSANINEHKDYVNFKERFFNRSWIDGHLIPAQYVNTYFTLVTETIVEKDCRFITEKTYKPLLAGHPFVALATPGHYEYLHKLGFETWPDLIDESFDMEVNIDRRIDMITKQVQKLCTSDLNTFLQQAESICRHNHQHFIKYRADLFKQVHERLVDFFSRIRRMSQDFFSKNPHKI